MARPIEQSESTEALPNRETNPLLNPLLADNMGRWAEVYFTSPPEKREEAVQELVRELEREKRDQGTTATNVAERRPLDATQIARIVPPSMMFREEPQDKTCCPACGQENPATHQFCGMCGSRLKSGAASNESHRQVSAASAEHYETDRHEQETQSYEPAEAEITNPPHDSEEHETSAAFHPVDNANELPLFRSILGTQYEGDENWEYDEEPPSNPYRYYIALVLAIIIGGLGYMAWRGAQANQSSREASPPPPPAPVTQPSPAPATSSTPPARTPSNNASSQEPAAPVGAAENAENKTPAAARPSKVARRAPVPQPAAERSPAPSAVDNGSAELATARQYLSGSGSHARDSAEAAKWLWRSMAKHNGQATLLLADLYLRGDGVGKSCDQGRVLLDSAARQGVAGAGERLRNLQAFGCH